MTRAPWCYDRTEHGPHIDVRAGGSGFPGECPGVSAAEASVQDMLDALDRYVMDHGGPRAFAPPPGLCLEMHPRAYYFIRANWQPTYEQFTSGQETPIRADIPVRVNPELPEGSWRLAVITVDVLLSGVIGNAE